MILKPLLCILLLLLYSITYSQNQKQKAVSPVFSSWSCYGGDPGGSRYSSLTQINDGNVHTLKTAWVFRTNELEKYKGTEALKKPLSKPHLY